MKKISIEVWLFALFFISFAYFYNGTGPNQNSRLAPVYSFVEPGYDEYLSFRIDRFVKDHPGFGGFTEDWSNYEGHYYSNKAPGAALMAIPIYFLLYHFEKEILGMDPAQESLAIWNPYFLNLWVGVFWIALALVCFFRWMMKIYSNDLVHSLFLTFVLGFGTLVFPFSTQFWSHPTFVAFLIFAFARLSKTKASRDYFLGGLFAGIALLVDYLGALGIFGALAYLIFEKSKIKNHFYFLSGLFVPVLLLCIYQKICFGGYFVNAPTYQNAVFKTSIESLSGFTSFSWEAFTGVLFSLRRGLFLYIPIFIFSLYGAYLQWRSSNQNLVKTAAVMIVLFVIMNSCFIGWHGGGSAGPRYLMGSFPFWCLLLPNFKSLTSKIKWLYEGLAGVSLFNMLVISATSPMIFFRYENPLFGTLYGLFWNGSLQVNKYSFVHSMTNFSDYWKRQSAFNLGEQLFFLDGLWSLIPLFVFWGAMIWIFRNKINFKARLARQTQDP